MESRPPSMPATGYKVTLEHTVDGVVRATKSLTIQRADADVSKIVNEAIDLASSSQVGLFRTMIDGKHSIKATSVVDLTDPTVELLG